jgi:hypothetical protein
MKKQVWKLALPLSIILMFSFTKWWYTLPEDAPDTAFTGFPLAFVCNGWHTSMSLQIFVMEFLIDWLIYFAATYLLIWLIMQYLHLNKIPKRLAIPSILVAMLIAVFSIWVASFTENLFYVKRNFKMEVIATGYMFIWQHNPANDYYKFHPESKKEQTPN